MTLAEQNASKGGHGPRVHRRSTERF